MKCRDCPLACGVDRNSGAVGLCGGGRNARIAKTVTDFRYEEPCLGESVTAVFFSGCSLGCSYCQNHKISSPTGIGTEYDDSELAALFDSSDRPIDLVTPTHYISNIERAVVECRGAHIYIYNTSGYETPDGVRRAAEFSDVFLTDFKYGDVEIARRYSAHGGNYIKSATAALKIMRQTRDEWEESNGKRILKRGLIVRHLVLPGCVKSSLKALDMIADIAGTDTVLSLMSQFTPNGVGEPSARLSKLEYKIVAEHALKLGFNNGYFQRFESARSEYTPEF